MEGPHHQAGTAAGEQPPPSSPLAAPVAFAEANLPDAEAPHDQEVVGVEGDDQSAAQTGNCIDDFHSDVDDPQAFEMMRRDTTKIAIEALEFYNNKEGTNFVLRKPLLSRCNLFPGTLVIHANFTAKNIVDPAVLENNSPSQLFFSETLKVYRQPTRILNCLVIDKCSSDIRTGCAHCPSHMCDRSFYHPPLGNSDYGEDEEKDHARFDYDESTTSSGSDDE